MFFFELSHIYLITFCSNKHVLAPVFFSVSESVKLHRLLWVTLQALTLKTILILTNHTRRIRVCYFFEKYVRILFYHTRILELGWWRLIFWTTQQFHRTCLMCFVACYVLKYIMPTTSSFSQTIILRQKEGSSSPVSLYKKSACFPGTKGFRERERFCKGPVNK